jgi:hypothetical protein
MESQRMRVCAVALVTALALAVMPASASAASPVLEFVIPGHGFPTTFTANGGEVTAALTGFDTVVHCAGSHGEGVITGPRSTVSSWFFTECETLGGTEGGRKCKSVGANEKELKAEGIEADLVYIDQTRREVGMLLNPHGGVYLSFECAGESVKASGPFLSPVSPLNEESGSFTATLTRSGSTQTPSEYEGANGEKLQAIPMGARGLQSPVTTGVELSFAITPSARGEIRALTAKEVEAKQREEEAAAARQRREEEAGREEEVAAQKRREEAKGRHRQLTKALKRCRKATSRHKRVRCETRAKKRYGLH